jgi:hypothetical protein
MVHQVLTNGVVAAGCESDFDLCPHAVNRTDQDRLAHLGEFEARAERADAGKYIAGESAFGERLDCVDCAACFVYIDARGLVRYAFSSSHAEKSPV